MSDFLEANLSKFEGWDCSCCTNVNPSGYDSLVKEFREILKMYSLIGYHCTKLTEEEIAAIRADGMFLQNATTLNARIDQLLRSGLISSGVAQCLKDKNQANDGRASMLWFCFFEPFKVGGPGIGRFFRSWGGEALYDSHEENPVTGAALRSIGIPCLIKANVPISSMRDSKYPDGVMARALLSHLGHQLKIPIEHVGYSTKNISAQDVIEIIEHPSARFMELTKCGTWERYTI